MQGKLVLGILAFSLTLGVSTFSPTSAQAKQKVYHTTPSYLRGTWYCYNGGWQRAKFTAHTFRYNDYIYGGHQYITSNHLEVDSYNRAHHSWSIMDSRSEGGNSVYRGGKMKINGKYHRVMIVDGTMLFTHFKTKHHYTIPKRLRSF